MRNTPVVSLLFSLLFSVLAVSACAAPPPAATEDSSTASTDASTAGDVGPVESDAATGTDGGVPGITGYALESYIGTQAPQAPFASWVRGVARGVVGVTRREPPPYDEGETTMRREELVTAVTDLLPEGDVMMPVGGLGSGRDAEQLAAFMAMIESDGGAAYRHIIREQSLAVAELEGARNGVHWQLGNEINSWHMSGTMRAFLGEEPCSDTEGLDGCRNDLVYIPAFVEYFVAPSLEAIRDASQEAYGDPGVIRTFAGSIANAGNAAAPAWLEALLDYRIEGRFAPTLAGSSVRDLVSGISIHYVGGGGPIETVAERLDGYFAHVGTGGIQRMWATEELGIRAASADLGAISALCVAARYGEWAYSRMLSPDQVRFSLYGWQVGAAHAKTVESLGTLVSFATGHPLIPVPQSVPEGTEVHAFRIGTDRTAVAVFAEPRESTAVVELTAPEGATEIELHHFTTTEHTVTSSPLDGSPVFTLPAPTTLDEDSALLALFR